MKIKTAEATDEALDWLVTKCEGYDHEVTSSEWGMWGWATDWAQGGPLVEREGMGMWMYQWNEEGEPEVGWYAEDKDGNHVRTGPTPLIAAMRCYVASILGDEVEIPKELT